MDVPISGKVLLLLSICQLSSVFLFMAGLWPIRTSLNGHASWSSLPPEPSLPVTTTTSFESLPPGELYKTQVKRLVVMVIDALRSDFITVDNFPYTTSNLLNEGKALMFKGKAHPPTVTLPKIKTITSGTIPSYTDVLLNFNAQSFTDDNFVYQARSNNKKIIFYGDDTWVRLFPGHFARYDGTTSFYVNDYTEVDDNVTRHLGKELQEMDWDVLILHYLGLDHIGHVHGPFSSLVQPKLLEMDGIIEKLSIALSNFEKIDNQPSMLIICGDHGMSDYGSHGGSTPSETSVPLIFVSSKKFSQKADEKMEVSQSCLAPTISILMGLPIPLNNIGCALFPVISALGSRERLYALFVNAHQIIQLVNVSQVPENKKEYYRRLHRNAVNKHAQILAESSLKETAADEVVQLYIDAITEMSNLLLSKAVDQDLYSMVLASILLWQVLAFLLGKIMHSDCSPRLKSYVAGKVCIVFCVLVFLHWSIRALFSIERNLFFKGDLRTITSLLFLLAISWLTVTVNVDLHFLMTNVFPPKLFIFSWILHSLSLFATSFIEEEHQTWYFLSTTFHYKLAITFIYSSYSNAKLKETAERTDCFSKYRVENEGKAHPNYYRISVLIPLILTRVFRSWNQTGDKWAHLKDIRYWLYEDDNKIYLDITIGSGLFILGYLRWWKHSRVGQVFLAVSLAVIWCFQSKIALFVNVKNTVELTPVHSAFFFIGLLFLEPLFIQNCLQKKVVITESLVTCWLLINCLLVRQHNIILLSFFALHERLISRFLGSTTTIEITTIYYGLGMASYFYLGNSNNLARIDITAGYVGQSNYSQIASGLLVWCHMYAGPCFWMLSLLSRLMEISHRRMVSVRFCCVILLLGRSLPLACFVTSVFLQRSHLFVWSVFSPKLLFEAMHSYFFIVIICIFLVVSRFSHDKIMQKGNLF